jgi:poly(hydroxyalkanoate) granule-associated protein
MLKKAKAEAERKSGARRKAGAGDAQGKAMADAVLESSRQIWLAGLGAFARAKDEGMKAFETLVQQGQVLETRTKKAASDTATAARDAAQTKAKEMQAKAGGTWDKLEQVFEDRVARALSRLGVYTQNDVERLAARVDALSEAVNELIKVTGAKTRVRTRSPVERMVKGAVSSATRTATGAVSTATRTARKTVRTASKVAKGVKAAMK